MMQYHLLGAGSSIAQLLAKKLATDSSVNLYSTSGYGEGLDTFLNKNIQNSVVIYFCNIQDDLGANLNLLETVIQYCKKFNCQFFFVSSINAEAPKASLYSKIKYECEKIVINNGYIWIRLAIVVSEPAFSSYKALKGLNKMPLRFIFDDSQYIHFTDINSFLSLDFCNLNMNTKLYSSSVKLNDFFGNAKNKFFSINIAWLIAALRKINNSYPLKSIFGRLLTLTAFDRDFLK